AGRPDGGEEVPGDGGGGGRIAPLRHDGDGEVALPADEPRQPDRLLVLHVGGLGGDAVHPAAAARGGLRRARLHALPHDRPELLHHVRVEGDRRGGDRSGHVRGGVGRGRGGDQRGRVPGAVR